VTKERTITMCGKSGRDRSTLQHYHKLRQAIIYLVIKNLLKT